MIYLVTPAIQSSLAHRKLRGLKTVDEEAEVSCLVGRGKVHEEVWQDEASRKVVRYNLAFINHFMHRGDNGRVLGYDAAHGHHHRHFLGKVEEIEFSGYEKLAERFWKEVSTLRKKGKL